VTCIRLLFDFVGISGNLKCFRSSACTTASSLVVATKLPGIGLPSRRSSGVAGRSRSQRWIIKASLWLCDSLVDKLEERCL
jgi:hypothetical protein